MIKASQTRVRGLLRLRSADLLARLEEKARDDALLASLYHLLVETTTVDEQSLAMKQLGT